MASDDVLEMYTVYRSPLDHPGQIVRQWLVIPGVAAPRKGHVVYIGESLAAARLAVPAQCGGRLERSPEDDPAIVETWL